MNKLKYFLASALLIGSFTLFSKNAHAQTAAEKDLTITAIDGSDASGSIETTNRKPRFCGTSNFPNTTLISMFDSEASLFTTTDSNGNWCAPQPVGNLSNGSHTFSVSTTVNGLSFADQVNFTVVDSLPDTGSDILLGVVIAAGIALLAFVGYAIMKKK